MKILRSMFGFWALTFLFMAYENNVAAQKPTQDLLVPTVKISGNDGPFDYGDLAILSADYTQSNLTSGPANVTFNWTVVDDGKVKKVFISSDGKQIAFAVGLKPKKITVFLDVNYLFETKKTITVTDKDGKNPTQLEIISDASIVSPAPLFVDIVVGVGPVPPLPNPPGPTPTPTPTPIPPVPPVVVTFPEGKFGMSKFTYDSFVADTNIDAASKIIIAGKLADGLDGIAAKIAAISTYTDIATILADTKVANDAAFASIVGFDMTRADPLKAVIKQQIMKLYTTQKLNTASDLATLYKEMSLGLRSVK